MIIYIQRKERRDFMPDHVLVEEIFNDLIEEVEYIKLKAHLSLNKK